MRQVLNMMSTYKLTSNEMDFDGSKDLSVRAGRAPKQPAYDHPHYRVASNEKHTIMTPFGVIEQMLGPYFFSPTSRKTLNDKIDMYFHDFGLVPLMVQVCLGAHHDTRAQFPARKTT